MNSTLASALADRYELLRELGRGGMATVYLARDVRHARQVAIKVLHPELAAVLGAERFLSEITTTANLQHPHILPLFDSGTADGQLFYVMPFVEGETLRARLDRETQLPIADAVQLAHEVADALQYAHERGVIHRDIKPENILLQGGHALVADFGIALAVQHAGGQRMTQTGLSLGTPQYMAPEQAMGEKTIDARADIYALGAVTYEMLAGEPPFTGPTAQAIVAKVMTGAPTSLRSLRAKVPDHIDAGVHRALEKLPADRFASAREFEVYLRNPLASAAPGAARSIQANSRTVSRRLFATTSLGLAGLAAFGFWRASRTPPSDTRPVRFTLEVPDSNRFAPRDGFAFAIAPDGSEIAYRGVGANGPVLFRRSLDALTVTEIPGTYNPLRVQYDADGKTLYVLDYTRQLFRHSLSGGSTALVDDSLDRPIRHGDGFIVQWDSRLWRTDADGRNRRLITAASSITTRTHVESNAAALPDAGAVLFNLRTGDPEQIPEIAIATLADGAITRLGLQGMFPSYVRTGHILFVRQDGLYAVPFDARTLTLTGEPLLLEREVLGQGSRSYDVSENGVLAYAQASDVQRQRVVVVDQAGREQAIDLPEGSYTGLRFSPDGSRIAFHRSDEDGSDIWIFNRRTKYLQRLTNDGVNILPVWWPSGSRLAWIRRVSDTSRIVWQASDGSGGVSTLAQSPISPFHFRFAPDARAVAVVVGPPHRHDIALFPLDSTDASSVLAGGRGDDLTPSISPDGRWMVSSNDISNRYELLLTEVAHPETRIPLTTTGGSSPLWGGDGRSIYYLGPQHIMRLQIGFSPRVEVTRLDTLFVNPLVRQDNLAFWIDFSPATGEFVFAVPTRNQQSKLVVVTGWLDELERRFARRQTP